MVVVVVVAVVAVVAVVVVAGQGLVHREPVRCHCRRTPPASCECASCLLHISSSSYHRCLSLEWPKNTVSLPQKTGRRRVEDSVFISATQYQ